MIIPNKTIRLYRIIVIYKKMSTIYYLQWYDIINRLKHGLLNRKKYQSSSYIVKKILYRRALNRKKIKYR